MLFALFSSSLLLAEKSDPLQASEMQLPAPRQASSFFYGIAQISHGLNSYYRQNNMLLLQEPSLQLATQLGFKAYQGAFDFYGTLLARKFSQSQQIVQERTKISADIYPVRSDFGFIRQYNILLLPYKKDSSPYAQKEYQSAKEQELEEELSKDGTVYVLGLNPQWQLGLPFSIKTIFELGSDGGTFLFSRPQVIENSGGMEDTELRYFLGNYISLKLGDIRQGLELTASAKYQSKFYPIYQKAEDSFIKIPRVYRFSFYKLSLRYQLRQNLSILNDFYHYFNGLFAEQRSVDYRRYSNEFALEYRL